MRICQSAGMVEQYRFPRSKKRRIQKKWWKDKANFKGSTEVILDERNRVIYCHPSMYTFIKAQLTPSIKGTGFYP